MYDKGGFLTFEFSTPEGGLRTIRKTELEENNRILKNPLYKVLKLIRRDHYLIWAQWPCFVFIIVQQQLYREPPNPFKPDWLKMNSFQNFDQSALLNIYAEGDSWSVEWRQHVKVSTVAPHCCHDYHNIQLQKFLTNPARFLYQNLPFLSY